MQKNKECDIINKKGCDSMKMVAHRGYSKYELENTKEAFLAAANRSYYGIETDVVLLKDRSMVLFHDDDLKRLAGLNINIRDLTYPEALKIELNERGTYHTYKYHIATLLEYLRICKHYKKIPVIELKWGFDNDAVDELMKLIIDEDLFENSMIICYTMSTILYLKEKYPLYHTQFLLGYLYSEELINKCLEENLNLDLRCDLVTKELVDRFHQKGLEVNTWTVDSKEEYERLKKCGVDYITTNILE